MHVAHPARTLALKSTQWNVTCQINEMNSTSLCVNWKGMQKVYAARIDKTDKLYCLGYFFLSLITKELDGTLNSNISFYFLVIFMSCNNHCQKKNEKRNNFLGIFLVKILSFLFLFFLLNCFACYPCLLYYGFVLWQKNTGKDILHINTVSVFIYWNEMIIPFIY